MNKRNHEISLFVIACIILNYFGKLFAELLELPLWLDAVGTVLTAYAFGPICGAIVGATVNVIYGFFSPMSYVYALTNIAVGLIVGVCAKKGFIENVFKTLSTAFLVTVASVTVSTILNCVFYDGMTGNKWGDGVIRLLQTLNFYPLLCCIIGEFYMDFLDKVVTMLVLFAVVRLYRRYREKEKKRNSGRSKIFVLVLLFFYGLISTRMQVQSAFAEEKEQTVNFDAYVQRVYNGENGLPGGVANDIAQTKDGILWVGTYGGLYRYNGNEFKLMKEFETVKNANCLYTDEEGRLWIGTNDNGVSICINESISNTITQAEGLPSDAVRCITKSSDGFYYVGTTGSLAILKLSSGLTLAASIPEIAYANSISADQRGNVAAVTNEGGLYVVRATEIVMEKTTERKGESYTCCTFDTNGCLYVGTTEGRIDLYELWKGEFKKKSAIECAGLTNVKSLTFSEDGLLFVCADNGVGYVLENEYMAINTNKFNSSIDHMLTDYQGNIWFTSSRLGLLCMSESVFSDAYHKAGLEEQVVNSIVNWKGDFYFGTDKGLDMTDGALTMQKTNFLTERLKGVRIRCLMVDEREHLWICTSGMGVLEAEENGSITVYDSRNGALGDKFRSAAELSDGTVVLAGDLGICYVRDGRITDTIGKADGLDNPKVLSLLEREDGSLLAGTDGNGIAVIREGRVADILQKEDGLGSLVILRMVRTADGKGVYVVTSNSLCYMETDGTIRVLEKFPYYNNFDVVEYGTKLFVLSSAGIYVVEKETLLAGEEPEYSLLDGKKGMNQALTPNAWNYLDASGNLFLSGDTGVIYFNLEQYETVTRSYRMLLKTIRVDDTVYTVDREETTVVPRGAVKIEISPEVVNYTLSDPYVSVYLEGFDNAPKVVPQSELSRITYTNLPTGEYTFHIAVLDGKNGNVTVENIYHIEKEKEIYDYWWFRFYVGFVFVLAIAYLTWLIGRTQIQKTLDIQKKELELVQTQLKMGNETIITIAKTVDAKDENTSQHSVRVSEYSVLIAERLGFSAEEKEKLRKTALLHDIGKIGIPDRVLNKPGRLSDEEYDIMKSHVTRGAEILKHFSFVENVMDGALYHHERYDGNGYASGLKGEEIPLNARIIGIADAFDAMTANRVYRKKLEFKFVLEELKKGKGTQFDPQIADILLGLIEDGTIDVKRLYEEETGTEGEER